MERWELEGMTVTELRNHARKNTELKGLAIAGMRKTDLIESILNPAWQPELDLNNGNGNGGNGEVKAGEKSVISWDLFNQVVR